MNQMHSPRNRGEDASDSAVRKLAGIDFNLLVPLVALLEEQSVTAAAERVGMTQPALSHALRRMRRLTGDELLVRQGAGMTLTPRARELLGPLREALRQTVSVVLPAGFDPSRDRRRICVAMTGSLAFAHVRRLTALVTAYAPAVEVVVRTIPIGAPPDSLFLQENVDVVMLPRGVATPLPREPLYDDRWVVVTGTDAPDRPAMELITSLPHVVFEVAGYRARPYEVLDDMGVRVEIGTRVSDTLLTSHAVIGTGGLAFHRGRTAEVIAPWLDLRVAEMPFPIEPMGVDLVWSPWLSDRTIRPWLGELLHEAVTPAGDAGAR